MRKNKRIIRLTESDLHRIVKESVNKILESQQSNLDRFSQESDGIEDVTENIYNSSRVLYHLTRPGNIEQIENEGVKPIASSQFRRSLYPERIYLLTDRCTVQDIKTYARQIGASYIVICDIGKMGYGYDFYKDPQSPETFAVFTDKPIPRECIEIEKIKDF